VYLYRAVDAAGQTIDLLLSAKRDVAATQRFFRKALKQPHTVNPRTITVDKNAAYPIAVKAMQLSVKHRYIQRPVWMVSAGKR
jgi:IS6 family transposase